MIDLTLEYTTRDGREVFGLVHCPGNQDCRRIIGVKNYGNGQFEYLSWYEDGSFSNEEMDDLDLIPKQERWRAEEEEFYLYVDSDGDIESEIDVFSRFNDHHYNYGNYFQTEEQAKASKFYKVFHD